MQEKNRSIDIKSLKWLWLLTGITCLFVFHRYVFGNQTVAFYDAGSDTKDQYLMWYNWIVNSLREGDFSAWDFSNGFGMNTLGHNLTDPFLMPVYLLGVIFGPEHLSHYMVYTQLAKIFIAGTACYFFLSEFAFEEKSKTLAAYMYAFNGYLIVWGQHYALGTAVVFLPLLLMYIERVLRNRKFSVGLCITTLVIICSSFYQGYMCMLWGGIYTCMRILMQENTGVKKKCQGFFMTAGCMVLGVLMAAFRLFPSAAAQIGGSGRLSSEKTIWERIFDGNLLWSTDHYKTIIYRIFSSNIQGNGENVYLGPRNYYEDASLFFSTLFVILLLQYVATIHRQQCSRKRKLLQYFSVLLCTALVVIPAASVPFNGFVAKFFRHTFLLMPLFALVSAIALNQIFKNRKIHVPALILSILGMVAVYGKAYTIFDDFQYQNNALYLCLSGLVIAGALFALCKKKADMKSCCVILTAALVVNVAADSNFSYSPRVTLSKNHAEYYSETYCSSANEALAWLEEYDDSFYRVEKDYFTASSCLDSQAQDYRGMSAYNSNQNAGIKKFVNQVWPQLYNENDKNHMQFQNAVWDHVMASLSGVKYILSKSSGFNVEGYEFLHQVGDVYIYENTNTDSIGKFFSKTITQKKFEKNQDELNTRALLTDVLIVEEKDEFNIANSEIQGYEKQVINDILSEKKIKKKYVHTAGEGPITWKFQVNGEQAKKYSTLTMECNLKVTGRTEVKVLFDDQYEHTLVANKINDEFLFSVPNDTTSITFTVSNPTADVTLSNIQFYGYESEQTFSEGAVIEMEAPEKDTLINGHISARENGMVMLAIPAETGWKVYLDGEEQTICTVNYGFIGFSVEKGEHELKLVFEASLLTEGILVSAAGFLAFFTLVWIGRKRRKKQQVSGKEE